MRSLRLFSLMLTIGALAACGNISPVASDEDCTEDTPEYCDDDFGYMGSDS